MLKNLDYVRPKRRFSRKRDPKWKKYALIGGAAALILIFALLVRAFSGMKNNSAKSASASDALPVETESTISEEERQRIEEEEKRIAEINSVVDSYQNLGIVKVDGYLNMRESPDKFADVIGKLHHESACEILNTDNEEWHLVRSGGLEGYVHSGFMITGEEAKELAKTLVKDRAIINTEKLNIRQEPSTDAEIVDNAYKGERYEVLEVSDGWVKIAKGYLAADYVEIRKSLNEARKLDLRSMVLNLYDNLGISNVQGYLNVREEPKEDGKIIGKMTSKAAGDILETLDGWYKIRSGKITGYVKSDYILTGDAAKNEALNQAELMAVVSTDVLNVRSEPNTEAKIWTQISNSERYSVVSQQDGWVEIELEDDNNAFVSTDFVDVRYALNEAIKFSPLEEAAMASQSRRTKIVNYALQFLGNRYVWGGTSLTHGCDCSGFTMGVLGNFGVGLPHYSVAQSKLGKKISSSEMRPGDLIFYSNSRGTINHVAMYIGNGQVVHAASRRSGIKISAWNYRNPTTIRNVLGD
ncbi:MAG: SH3 domain-containing protein [Johnsonella sp.]|nr:SH3 domain-containing protein [Johnsonella sp.]